MSELLSIRVNWRSFAVLFGTLFFLFIPIQAAENQPGLSVTIRGPEVADFGVFAQLSLYVAAGETASPFVPAGSFSATWNGFISSDIRADYIFSADCAGELRIVINDLTVLEGASEAVRRMDGRSVRLNKGTNALKVEFKSPKNGDAALRVYWSNRETPLNPVPKTALTQLETEELARSREIHAGRDLFAEFRCAKCHASPNGMPELNRDAPALSGIGSLLRFEWLVERIRDPHSSQPNAHMPALFQGTNAQPDAEAAATYLVSLTDARAPESSPGNAESGHTLYQKLECSTCHRLGETGPGNDSLISLGQVGKKFAPGALAAFLEKPEARYSWTRMPNFKLSAEEAANLAAWLIPTAEKPTDRATPNAPGLIERGRRLIATSGCLNCHHLGEQESELSAKPLAALSIKSWNSGCLADTPLGDSRAPRFSFTESERKALRAFGATDRASLGRHVAADFALRQSVHLNCRACHGKLEGVPSFDLVGQKLKPEWSERFIAGQIELKPRPWLEARMPSFPAFASNLAVGSAAQNGLPAHTPPDPAPDNELATTGQKLVSSKGGFSCVSCHAVGEFAATRVFEAPGINFAHTYNRVQPDYFRRWVRNPSSLDSTTKMPGFFDEEGRSPLRDVFEGDGPKTIQALWEYLRLGEEMPPPE